MAISSFVESIQYIELTLGSSAATVSGALDQGQIISNCIPFFTSEVYEYYSDSRFIDAYFTPSHINFERYTAGTEDGTIKCYVVEFNPAQVRVQQGTFSVDTATLSGTATLSATLNGSDKAAFVFGWKSDNASYNYSYSLVEGQIIDNNTILFEKGWTGANISGHYFLFEDLGNNFLVEHHCYHSSTETLVYRELNSYFNKFRSFMLTSSTSGYYSTNSYVGRYTYRVTVPSEKFFRIDYMYSSAENRTSVQIVTFLDETKVYIPFRISYADSSAESESYIFGPGTNKPLTCNLSTSAIIYSAPMGINGVTTGVSYTAGRTLSSTFELTSSGTIGMERDVSSVATYFSDCYAVDWAGITVSSGINNDVIEEGTGENQSFVKSIENFKIDLSAPSDYEGYCVLTKGQNINNCVMFYNARPEDDGSYIGASLATALFIKPNIVYAKIGLEALNITNKYININVIEFWPEQVKVQYGQVYMSGIETTKDAAVDKITDHHKVLIYSKATCNTSTSLTYPNTGFIMHSFDEAPLLERDLGYNTSKTGGGTQINSPIDNGDYYTFDGTDQCIEWPESYVSESSVEFKARFRPHNTTRGTSQVLWKSGDGTNGVALGFDASNNFGIFGRSSSSLTSITISGSNLNNNHWYRAYATYTEILVYDETLNTTISGSGTIVAANSTIIESIGGCYNSNGVITASTGEYFDGDIDYVRIFDINKVDIMEPTISGISYINFERCQSGDIPLDISYWLIEDLQNNFYTSHKYGVITTSRENNYILDKIWTCKDTFVLGNYYVCNASNDPDDNGMAMYFECALNPVVISRYATAGTIYYFVSVFKFLSGKIHCSNNYYHTIDSDVYTDITYDDNFSSNSISAILGNTQSIEYTNISLSTYWDSAVVCPEFYDYENNILRLYRGGATSTYITKAGLAVVDWVGYKNSYINATSTTPTKGMIQSIEEFYSYYSSDVFSCDIVPSKNQNVAQCVPFFIFSTSETAYETYGHVLHNFNDDMFLLNFGEEGDKRFKLTLIEFNQNVIIQSGVIALYGTTICEIINEVDLTRTFLSFSAICKPSANNAASEHAVRGKFNSSTELEFERYSSYTGDIIEISWYVVECTAESDFWVVQHLYGTSLTSSNRYLYGNMFDWDRSIMIGTWSCAATSNDPDDSFHSLYPVFTDSVNIYNYTGTYALNSANVEIITFSEEQFEKGLKILPYSFDVTNNGSADHDLYDTYDVNRSMIIHGANSGESTVNTSSPSYNAYCFIYYEFKDSSTVTSYNDSTSSAAYISYTKPQIVQWPKFNTHYMEGYVKEENNPVQRAVRAYRASTGELIDSTTSASGTGYFLLETAFSDEHYVVALDDEEGTVWNDLIYGQLVPTVISGSFAYNEGWVTTSGFNVGIPLARQ